LILYYFLERQNHCSWILLSMQSGTCFCPSMISEASQSRIMQLFVEKIPWCLWLHVWLNAFNFNYDGGVTYMIFWEFMQRRPSLHLHILSFGVRDFLKIYMEINLRSLYLCIVFYHLETLRSLHVHEKEIVAMTTRITMWFVSISRSLWKAWNI
jgi:hypothetical protein